MGVVRSAKVVLDQRRSAQSRKTDPLLVLDISNGCGFLEHKVKVNVDEAIF